MSSLLVAYIAGVVFLAFLIFTLTYSGIIKLEKEFAEDNPVLGVSLLIFLWPLIASTLILFSLGFLMYMIFVFTLFFTIWFFRLEKITDKVRNNS